MAENIKKLVIVDANGVSHVCDEYYPQDVGRVNVLGLDRCSLGTFDAAGMVFDHHKVAVDVERIVYCDYEWPSDLPKGSGRLAILQYFGLT